MDPFPLAAESACVRPLPTAGGIPVFSFVTPLTAPVSYAGPIVGIWMLIGVVYLAYLWKRHRQRVVDTGLVHLDAVEATEPVRFVEGQK